MLSIPRHKVSRPINAVLSRRGSMVSYPSMGRLGGGSSDATLMNIRLVEEFHIVRLPDLTLVSKKFHKALDEWYHPNSYAIYCADKEKLSFGTLRWTAHKRGPPPSTGNLGDAACERILPNGGRVIRHSTGVLTIPLQYHVVHLPSLPRIV